MVLSAALMAAAGLTLTFLPGEILAARAAPAQLAVLLQVCGALYAGFAMLNWTARGQMLGGIYGRPIVVANLLHFVAGGLAILKGRPVGAAGAAAALVYAAFAAWFGLVLFSSPHGRQPDGRPMRS